MDDVPREVIEHYGVIDEGRRITRGLGRLELERTRDIVRRHLPEGRLTILDVGGATGVHAQWLASDGHDVHVVDLVPAHVEEVRALSATPGRITAEVGDARSLALADASYDAVLLLGPLYHLTTKDDRVRALAEVRRVVQPGGLIFAAATRASHRCSTAWRGGICSSQDSAPSWTGTCEKASTATRRTDRTGSPRPTCITPTSSEPKQRNPGSGSSTSWASRGWWDGCPISRRKFDTDEYRDVIMFSARAVESEPALLGLSAHLLLVARTPL